jgi:hypothetical protein
MANWCSARLTVAGPRADVLAFSRLSRAKPSAVFGADMLSGETDGLRAERVKALEPSLAKKVYRFQVRNDDGREHFCQVSRQFPALCFVLAYWDPNVPPSGSYFIRRGRALGYELPESLCDAVMAQHGYVVDSEDPDEWLYWEASWELMDLAEAYWRKAMFRALRGHVPRTA